MSNLPPIPAAGRRPPPPLAAAHGGWVLVLGVSLLSEGKSQAFATRRGRSWGFLARRDIGGSRWRSIGRLWRRQRERGRWADTAKNFLTRRGRGGFGLGFTIWDLNTIFYERKWDQIRVSTFKKRQVNLLFELNFFEPPHPS